MCRLPLDHLLVGEETVCAGVAVTRAENMWGPEERLATDHSAQRYQVRMEEEYKPALVTRRRMEQPDYEVQTNRRRFAEWADLFIWRAVELKCHFKKSQINFHLHTKYHVKKSQINIHLHAKYHVKKVR